MHLILFLDSVVDYPCLRTVLRNIIRTWIELYENVSCP